MTLLSHRISTTSLISYNSGIDYIHSIHKIPMSVRNIGIFIFIFILGIAVHFLLSYFCTKDNIRFSGLIFSFYLHWQEPRIHFIFFDIDFLKAFKSRQY
jgi:hypothetical protein